MQWRLTTSHVGKNCSAVCMFEVFASNDSGQILNGRRKRFVEIALRGPRLSKHLAIICCSNQLHCINLQMERTFSVESVDFRLTVQILTALERFFEVEVICG